MGVNAALGYGLGLVGAWVWREIANRPRRTPRPGAWRVYAVTAAVSGALAVVLGERWQRELRDLVGLPEVSPFRLLLIPVIAALVFLLLLTVSRGFRRVHRWVSGRLARRTSERAARAIGLLVVVGATVLLATGVVWDGAIRIADSSYALTDRGTPGAVRKPTTDLRSGGPGSLLGWQDLGREGRTFVAAAPRPTTSPRSPARRRSSRSARTPGWRRPTPPRSEPAWRWPTWSTPVASSGPTCWW